MQPWTAILGVLLLTAALVPVVRARGARRRRLGTLAMRKGWAYSAGDPWDLPAEMEGLWLGAWGHDRACRDVASVPVETGALWLAEFERQMSSGRDRHAQRLAVALVHVKVMCGGIAILPDDELFANTQPFERYRRSGSVEDGQVWAERPEREKSLIGRLMELWGELPESAAIEARGNTAAIYWLLEQPLDEMTLERLETAGRRTIEILGEYVRSAETAS